MIWVAFFSQTGSEIAEISRQVGRWPDYIITNDRPDHLRTIHPDIVGIDASTVVMSNKPTAEEYMDVLGLIGSKPSQTLITLHGWLRILPEQVIDQYPYIFNGHPGLITRYPELKGKDPQKKAWTLGLQTSGCVIHKVTAGVDEGPVIREKEIPIRSLTLDQLFANLHSTSVKLWVDFLKKNWL